MKKSKLIPLALGFILTFSGSALAADPLNTPPPSDPAVTQPVTNPVVNPDIVDLAIVMGKIKNVDLANKKITLAVEEDQTKEFTYSDKTKFEYQGAAFDPANLTLNSKILVKSIIFSDNSTSIVKINVLKIESQKYVGAISALDLANKSITINREKCENKDSFKFNYDSNTVFEYNGQAIAPENLPMGSLLEVKYQTLADNSLKVLKVKVVKLGVNRFEGKLTQVDMANKTITLVNSKESKVFAYDDQTKFLYKGLIINAEQLVANSRVAVTFTTMSDNTVKVSEVKMVNLDGNKDKKEKEKHKKSKKQSVKKYKAKKIRR